MALISRRFPLLAAFLSAALALAQQPSVAILHVHVLPMDRERILDDQTVVVAKRQNRADRPIFDRPDSRRRKENRLRR